MGKLRYHRMESLMMGHCHKKAVSVSWESSLKQADAMLLPVYTAQ